MLSSSAALFATAVSVAIETKSVPMPSALTATVVLVVPDNLMKALMLETPGVHETR
jgi:hypothetical protein